MSVAVKREIVEDQLEISVFACAEPLKKKARTARKCTGVGGKLPRQPIKTKPLRKESLPVAPVRIVPMRSVKTRSKPLVQTIQDSDDSDIECLDDSNLSDYQKIRSNNIKERGKMFTKFDISGAKKICSNKGLDISIIKSKNQVAMPKNNVNNNSSIVVDQPDIEIIDENNDIICDSDINIESDIICEPDINIAGDYEESTDIEVIDFSGKNHNDINSNTEGDLEEIEVIRHGDKLVNEPEITKQKDDIICEPGIINLESNSKEVSEIEMIEHSKKSTVAKESFEEPNNVLNKNIDEEAKSIVCESDINSKSNSEDSSATDVIEYVGNSDSSKSSLKSTKSCTNDTVGMVSDEVLDIGVIEYSNEVPIQKESIYLQDSTELTDIEENLKNIIPQLITL